MGKKICLTIYLSRSVKSKTLVTLAASGSTAATAAGGGAATTSTGANIKTISS